MITGFFYLIKFFSFLIIISHTSLTLYTARVSASVLTNTKLPSNPITSPYIPLISPCQPLLLKSTIWVLVRATGSKSGWNPGASHSFWLNWKQLTVKTLHWASILINETWFTCCTTRYSQLTYLNSTIEESSSGIQILKDSLILLGSIKTLNIASQYGSSTDLTHINT